MDKDYIRGAMQEIIPLLAECYTEGLTRDPALAGELVVEFTIDGEPDIGAVIGESAIDAKASTLIDATVAECVQETMYALQMDAPADGGVITVRYPFAFANTPSP